MDPAVVAAVDDALLVEVVLQAASPIAATPSPRVRSIRRRPIRVSTSKSEALVDHLVVGPDEGSTLVGRRRGERGAAGHQSLQLFEWLTAACDDRQGACCSLAVPVL